MPIENIVLDLDETLIHSVQDPTPEFLMRLASTDINYKMWNEFVIFERPHLAEFIAFVFSKYKRICIWTAAEREYADFIISNILRPYIPPNKYFDYFFHREHCKESQEEHGHMKYLGALFDYDSKYARHNTILIEDNPSAQEQDSEHVILVKPFMKPLKKTKDTELKKLVKIINKRK